MINTHQVTTDNTAKYLDMILDAKLYWKELVKKKMTELNMKLRKMNWLLGRIDLYYISLSKWGLWMSEGRMNSYPYSKA